MESGEWVRRIKEAGLEPLAVPFLEATRALGLVAAHVLLLGQPLLAGLIDEGKIEQAIAWLEEPQKADLLLQQISEGEKP